MTPGTRLAALGLVVASVVAAGCSTVIEAGNDAAPDVRIIDVTVAPTTTAAGSSSGGPSTTAGGATGGVRFKPGDCLVWDQTTATATFGTVDCAQPHLAEVAGLLDLSGRFAADATFPSSDEVGRLVDAACGPVVNAYLNGKSPSDAQAGLVLPTQDAWAAGDRAAFCTVGLARVDGKRPEYTGRIADRR